MSSEQTGAIREVPREVQISVVCGNRQIRKGCIALAVATFLTVSIGKHVDRAPIYGFLYSDLRTVEGKVTLRRESAFGFGILDIYAITFTYFSTSGLPYESVAFARKQLPGDGQTLVVTYPVGHPVLASIEGYQTNPYPFQFHLVHLLLFIAAAYTAYAIGLGIKDLHLLSHGLLSSARLIDKTQSLLSGIQEDDYYTMTFEYRDQTGQRHELKVVTNQPEILEDEEEEQLFYLPDSPTTASLVDNLPGEPLVGPDGEIHGLLEPGLVRPLALPCLCIAFMIWQISRFFS